MSRIGSQRGRLELFIGQPLPGDCDSRRRLVEHFVELGTEDYEAAGNADNDQIDSDTEAAPEMNLKKRAPRPDALRPAPDAFE